MKQKLRIPTILTFLILMKISQSTCEFDEILLEETGECTKCYEILFGCRTCYSLNILEDEISYVCSSCKNGFFLYKERIEVEDDYYEINSVCVADCNKAHPDYISNYNSLTCDYCGKDCMSCSIKTGCLQSCPTGYVKTNQYSHLYDKYPDPAGFQYSTFEVCYQCGDHCLTCMEADPSICTICEENYILEDGECVSSCMNFGNERCLTCNVLDSEKCVECDLTFWLNENNCGDCIEGCDICGDMGSCDRCSLNYLKTEKKDSGYYCSEMDEDEIISNFWNDCLDIEKEKYTEAKQCNLCNHRYPSEDYTSCLLHYNKNYFYTYSDGNKLIQYCSDKSRCIGPGLSDFLTCGNKNKYVLKTLGHQPSGTCRDKINTLESVEIIVKTGSLVDPNLQEGTLINPFDDLDNAIRYGLGRVAKYTSGEINIYLSEGPHYLKRKQDFYFATTVDEEMMEISITIKPMWCSDFSNALDCVTDNGKVTIINKRRENMKFPVYKFLQMESVIIDSIDSIIPFDDDPEDCLNTNDQCCKYNQDTSSIEKVDELTNYDCQIIEKPKSKCLLSEGSPVFEMKLSEFNYPATPNKIILKDCEFYNFFYNFYSFIGFQKYGGYIQIENTIFKRFSSCGAIVSNFFPSLDTDLIENTINKMGEEIMVESISRAFEGYVVNGELPNYTINNMTDDINPYPSYKYYSDDNSGLKPNFDLKITDSTFEYMDFEVETLSTYVLVDSDYDFQFRASVINLNRFLGEVYLANNVFQNNYININDCPSNSNEDYDDNKDDTLYGNLKTIQINSLINIVQHNHLIQIMENTFTQNSGVKGIIYIEMLESSADGVPRYVPVVFYKNKFNQNSGYYSSNVIFLRMINSQFSVFGAQNPDIKYQGCTGAYFEENTFYQNVGCHEEVAGAIFFKCTEKKTQNGKFDEYIISSSDIDDTFEEIQVSGLTHSSNIKTITYGSVTLSVDMNDNIFKKNTFQENYSGNDFATLMLVGVLYSNFEEETYIDNTNMFMEALHQLNTPIEIDGIEFPELINKLSNQLTEDSICPYAIGTLYLEYALEIRFSGCTFDGNWMIIEKQNPSQKRAEDIMIVNSYGILSISDCSFSNHYGIIDSNLNSDFSIDIESILSDSDTRRDGHSLPLIWVSGSIESVSMSDCTFYNNSKISDYNTVGAIFYHTYEENQNKKFQQFNIQNCLFTYSKNLYGSDQNLLEIDFKSIIISNSIFSDNGGVEENQGKVFLLTSNPYQSKSGPDSISMTDLEFSNNQNIGFVKTSIRSETSVVEASADFIHYTASNINIIDNTMPLTIFLLKVKGQTCYFSEINYLRNYYIKEPCFEVSNLNKIIIEYFTVEDISSTQSTQLVSTNGEFLLYFSHNIIDCKKNSFVNIENDLEDILEYNITTNTPSMDESPLFEIDNDYIGYNNTFTHCYRFYESAIIIFDYFNEIESSFSYFGCTIGILRGYEAILFLEDVTFENNYGYSGSSLYLEGGYLYGDNIIARYCKSNEVAVMNLNTFILIEIYRSTFENNYAHSKSVMGGVMLANGSICEDVNFLQNEAEASAISLLYSDLTFLRCTFTDNVSIYKSGNIFTTLSTIYIKDSDFSYTSFENPESSYGKFVYLNTRSTAHIEGSTFSKGVALFGGAIYITGWSELFVRSCEFENCWAEEGGVIYGKEFQTLDISGTSFYNSTTKLENGDVLCLSNDKNMTSLESIEVTLFESAAFSFENLNLKIKYLSIYGNSQQSPHSAGINAFNLRAFFLSNSNFYNMIGTTGGAIYLNQLPELSESATIEFSHFESNSANYGGAIFLDSVKELIIQDCTFESNSVGEEDTTQKGGAIYYACTEYVDAEFICNLQVQKSSFNRNSAPQGGAIHWNDLEPNIGDSTFTDNSAINYGQDISSFPHLIVQVSEEIYKKFMGETLPTRRNMIHLKNTISEQEILSKNDAYIYSFQSGGNLTDLYFAIIDKYNQVVAMDDGEINLESQESSETVEFDPKITSTKKFTSKSGFFYIDEITFLGQPGTTQIIKFETDVVDFTRPINTEYLEKYNEETGNDDSKAHFKIHFDLRACTYGESFSNIGTCETCDSPSYYNIVPMNEPGDCTACKTDVSVCYGPSLIGPKPGYWRKTNVSDNFIECLLASACLGMPDEDSDPLGECDTGYQNTLCADCKAGFSRTSDYECSECPTESVNIVRITGIILLAIILIFFLVFSTIRGATQKKSLQSVYLRIFMNHLQLIVLTASFNLDWPTLVTSFFNLITPAANASKQMISFDCFLDARDPSDSTTEGNNTMRIIYQKMLMITLLPFGMGIGAMLFWLLIAFKRGSFKNIGGQFITTIIILLFLIHPTIVQINFDSLNCIELDTNDLRLLKDLEVECWSSDHMLYVGAIGIPALVLWGFGIPILGLIILIKVRNRLKEYDIKLKYGFMYNGYKHENYFWEIVIIFRKIGLVFIATFLRQSGIFVQALIVMLFTLVSLLINERRKPFMTRVLNLMESYSLVTGTITIYCGLCFVSARSSEGCKITLNEGWKWFFFLSIVGINAVFLVYWLLQMSITLKQKLLGMSGKLYTFMFLCCKKRQLSKEKAKALVAEEKVQFEELLNHYTNKIKTLYKQNKIPLTPKNHSQLLYLLDTNKNRAKILKIQQFKKYLNQQNQNSNRISLVDKIEVQIPSTDDEISQFAQNNQKLLEKSKEVRTQVLMNRITRAKSTKFDNVPMESKIDSENEWFLTGERKSKPFQRAISRMTTKKSVEVENNNLLLEANASELEKKTFLPPLLDEDISLDIEKHLSPRWFKFKSNPVPKRPTLSVQEIKDREERTKSQFEEQEKKRVNDHMNFLNRKKMEREQRLKKIQKEKEVDLLNDIILDPLSLPNPKNENCLPVIQINVIPKSSDRMEEQVSSKLSKKDISELNSFEYQNSKTVRGYKRRKNKLQDILGISEDDKYQAKCIKRGQNMRKSMPEKKQEDLSSLKIDDF